MRLFSSFIARAVSVFAFAVSLLAFAWATSSFAGAAPSGFAIKNIAKATYFNERLGITETVFSNPVLAIVAEVPAIEVDGRSNLQMSRGAFGEHYFTIRNTGNVDLEVVPFIDIQHEKNLFAEATLYWDQNSNGRIDGNEPAFFIDEALKLPIGDALNLIYAFQLSNSVQLDDVAVSNLIVEAKSVTSGRIVAGGNIASGRVTVTNTAIAIKKTVSRRSTDQGDELTFGINLRNNSEAANSGYGRIDNTPLNIDGMDRTGIVVRDDIPLNTVFVAIKDTGGMTALYHRHGDARHTYVSAPPAEPTEIDAVAFYSAGDYPVGRSSDVYFSVLLRKELGTVTVRNTAETFMAKGRDATRILSNEVVVHQTADAASRLSFVDPTSRQPISFGELDSDAVLHLVSGACNSSGEIDTVMVDVRSKITNDIETIAARETGPNTGVFMTVSLPMVQMDAPAMRDGVLATDFGDVITGSVKCGDQFSEATFLVHPGNFVFNSVTNAPVAEVGVALVDRSGARIAFATTDNSGYFAMPDVPAGQYRFEMNALMQFIFPSIRPSFSGFERHIQEQASFGEVFAHDGGPVRMIDLPVDPHYGVPLALEKSTDKAAIGTGDFVTYTIKAQNNMDQALLGAEIIDRFPAGAVLVDGSVKLGGAQWSDPHRDEDNDHVFALGDLGPREVHELTYVLRFTPTAKEGKLNNSAILHGLQAGTGQTRISGIAQAQVKLDNSGGVFSSEGTIIGSVFLDCNENGMREEENEPGVPGVKIITQEGLFVVTDQNGKYSIFGLRPVSHVLALQSLTLPAYTTPMVSRVADMQQGGSRMVSLKRGELRAEHFPLQGCKKDILDEVAQRVEAFDTRTGSQAQMLSDLPIDGGRADTRSIRMESGLATVTQMYGTDKISLEGTSANATRTGLAQKATETSRSKRSLEDIIKTLSPEFDFLDIEDGDHSVRKSMTVRLKGPADLTMRLVLNGKEVSPSRIGEMTVWAGGNIQAIEYVAIRLDAGENTLEMIGKGPFGNDRARKAVIITAPGDPAKIEIVAPETAPATPGTVLPIVVRILDENGGPVQASGTVTLNASSARWDVTDIRDEQPGIQAFIDNGEATFGLLAPQVSGTETISVSGSFGTASAQIAFTPNLDERVLVGIVEGSVALNGRDDLIDDNRLNAFEDTVTGLRGELYLKGRIRGDALLTLRYSSDRDTENRLFRDIRGDEYYPVYGDNSERGFDAQSSSNLFVKVERGASYVLYGDISAAPESPAFRLGGYSTLTTGAKAHWEKDHVSVTVFAARTGQKQRVIEFAGRGISGPYDIDLGAFREGSDQIDILVRDQDTGEIVSETRLRRLSDYVLDYFRNTIVFNAPVPQADDDGNPVSVRLTYQIEGDDTERYWLYGAEANVQVSDFTSVGVRAIRSDGQKLTEERHSVQSAYVQTQVGETGVFEAEVAHAENEMGQSGFAARASLTHKNEWSALKLEATHTDRHFSPQGSTARAGTDQVTLDYEVKIDDEDTLTASAAYVADRIADKKTVTGQIGYRRQVSEFLSGSLGLKVHHDLEKAGKGTRTSVLVGGDWRPQTHPDLHFKFQVEQPVTGGGDGLLTLGADYEFHPGFKLFGSTELNFRDQGETVQPGRTKIGMEYDVSEWLTGRSEFTSDGNGQIRTRFIQGFTGLWKPSEQVSLRFSLEHTEPLDVAADRLTSLAIGGKWTSADGKWIADADFDQTFEDSGRTFYANLGVAGEVSPDWTLLARSRFALDARGETDKQRHRLRAGAAYRPVQDPRLEMLAWYEHRLERETQQEEEHLWSVAGTWEAGPRLRLNGKYAGRFGKLDLTPESGGQEYSGLTQLVQAGATYEVVPKKFDASLNAYHMWDDQGSSSNALGFELGYVIDKGAMMSVGYNKSLDKMPNTSDFYQEGLYLRLRLKLDDSLWDKMDSFLGN